ncbi:MAG: NYN domain-containing protein [Chloroflexi bacterium]|nr:NYN domain-containing protein [Chloroflexota bacterium]
MYYLIDGHNLIGQLADIDLDDPNDESLLVQKLNGWTGRTRNSVWVVFDNGIPGGPSRMTSGRVKVHFAPHETSADSVIRKRIPSLKPVRDWTVVSDDHAVQDVARKFKVPVMRSTDFARLLDAPPPASRPTPDEDPDLRLTDDDVDDWLNVFGR